MADPLPSTPLLESHKADTPHLMLQIGKLRLREVVWHVGLGGLGFRSQPHDFGQPCMPFFLSF